MSDAPIRIRPVVQPLLDRAMEYAAELAAEGATVWRTDIDADRIGIMEGGTLVQEGTAHEIITRPANELMAKIHNSKQRMPWILPRNQESDWLHGKEINFQDVKLVAEPLGRQPLTLF